MAGALGWCSMLRQTLVFYPAGIAILEPRDQYLPIVDGPYGRSALEIFFEPRFRVWDYYVSLVKHR